MKSPSAKSRAHPWLEASLAFFSTILGLFAGSIFEAIAPPLFQISNLPYIAFCLISVLFLANAVYSVFLWRSTRVHIGEVVESTGSLAAAVGHRVKTVHYSQGYKELENRILAAKKEILILSECVNTFDWDKGESVWDADRQDSPYRRSFYAALRTKLIQERGKGVLRLAHIIQIAKHHRLEETLVDDAVLAESCRFIVDIARTEPEYACLRETGWVFGNSVIVIDGSFAHISFDVRKLDESRVDAPFVMLIDDPNSDAIANLLKLLRRIEINSTPVTRLD